jgi:hypothetical protein
MKPLLTLILSISFALTAFGQAYDIDSIKPSDKGTIRYLSIEDNNVYDTIAYEKLRQFDTINWLFIRSDKVTKIPTGNNGPVIDSISMYDEVNVIRLSQSLDFSKIRGLRYVEIVSEGLFKFPYTLVDANKLEYLYLQSDETRDTIPRAIKQLKQLHDINLFLWKTKNICKEVFEIDSLQNIDISCISIERGSHIDFKKLDKLKWLWIKISKAIDWNTFLVNPEFAKLENIKIESPTFKHSLPKAFYEMTSLEELTICVGNCNYIKSDISKLVNLKHLTIASNFPASKSGKKRIQSYLPNCKIDFSVNWFFRHNMM